MSNIGSNDQYWDKIPSPLISSLHRLVTSYYPIVSTQLSSIERGFYGLLNTGTMSYLCGQLSCTASTPDFFWSIMNCLI